MPTIRTLYAMAVDAVVRVDNEDPTIKTLPEKLKNDILRVASRLGRNANLSCLLHPKVRSLDLNYCQITDEQIHELCICSQLRSLQMNPDLYEYYNHSPKVLENLFLHLPKVIKLHIQRNDGLTDSAIHSLVEHCPLLKELDIGGCKNLTDVSLESLAELKYLTSLCLSGTKVGDTGLMALSNGRCQSTLIELQLINCLQVSDTGINAVYKNLKRLIHLDFSGCPKITSACQVLLGHVPLVNLSYTVYWN